VIANIAEGYGRYHYLDSLKHYAIARGELNETLAHLINAKILNILTKMPSMSFTNLSVKLSKP